MNNQKPLPADYIQKNRERIGACIRKVREQRGISEQQLADMVGVHTNTISRIEMGKFAITIDYLFKIGWILGLNILLEKN